MEMSVNIEISVRVREKSLENVDISGSIPDGVERIFYIFVDSPGKPLTLKADAAREVCEELAEYLGVRDYGIRAGQTIHHALTLKREFAKMTSEKVEIVFVEKESLTIELLNHFERELFFNTVTDIAEGEDEDTLPLVKQIIEDRE